MTHMPVIVRFTFDPKPPSASMSQVPTPRAATPSPQDEVPASVGGSPAAGRASSKASSTRSRVPGGTKANAATPEAVRTPPVTPSASSKRPARPARSGPHADQGGTSTPSSKVSYASATRRPGTPVYARPLGSAFSTPIRAGANPPRPPLSPVSVGSDSDTESSVTPSSVRARSPLPGPGIPPHAGQPSTPLRASSTPLSRRPAVIPGFGYHSAHYLKSIGQTKYANKAVELVVEECVSALWHDELFYLLDITMDQALELAYMIMMDCDEQGLLPVD